MKDWNVVVSVFQDGYSRALRALQKLGVAERSPYHNVLVMKVNDPVVLLEAIEKRTEESPALYDAISRVAPAMRNFDFLSEEEFVEKAKSIIREWLPRLGWAVISRAIAPARHETRSANTGGRAVVQ